MGNFSGGRIVLPLTVADAGEGVSAPVAFRRILEIYPIRESIP
jgi:hypothetical protein